jgi:hypothetical protein
MQIVIPEVLRAVTLRPASPRLARVRREAVTFVPHDGARCVVAARIPRPGQASGDVQTLQASAYDPDAR